MRKFFRIGFVNILAILMIFTVCGCAGNEAKTLEVDTSNPFYYAPFMDLDIDYNPGLCRYGDGFLLFNKYDADEFVGVKVQLDWTVMTKDFELKDTVGVEFPVEGNTIYDYGLIDDSKIAVLLRHKKATNDGYTFELLTYSMEGKQLSSANLAVESGDSLEKIVCVSLITGDGGVILATNTTISKLGSDGKLIKEVKVPRGFNQVENLFWQEENSGFVGAVKDGGVHYLIEFDYNEMSFGEKHPCGKYLRKLRKSTDYDFTYSDEGGIVGVDLKSNTGKRIVDFEGSNIIGANLNTYYFLDDETLLVTEQDGPTNVDAVVGKTQIYQKIGAEDVKVKKEITLGGIYLTDEIKNSAASYTKNSEAYKIRLIDYTDLYGEEAKKQFQLDLLTDNVPDIIVTDGLDDLSNYMRKGVFADLYPMMEQNGIAKDDYLANVLHAGSANGKLCVFIPKFSVKGAGIVSEEILQGKDGLSVTDMVNLEKKFGIEGKGIFLMSRELILSEGITYSGNTFYDVESGACNFETEEFGNLLEWSRMYPSNEESAEMASNPDLKYPVYQMNEAVFEPISLSNYSAFQTTDYRDFDNKGILIGFPSASGQSKGMIKPGCALGISERCEDKDGAFAFVRLFMEDDYQNDRKSPYSGNWFPSKKSAFDAMAKEALTQKTTTLDIKGEKVEIEPISEKKLEMVRAFVENCDAMSDFDAQIGNLVSEEAKMYFNGQKSSAETASMIQNRIGIYVKEKQ